MKFDKPTFDAALEAFNLSYARISSIGIALDKALSTLPDAPGLTDEQWKMLQPLSGTESGYVYVTRAQINTVLARRTAAQAQEPPTMPAVEHVHKWVNGHCYNENCSALQPTVEQEADGDYVQKLCKAWIDGRHSMDALLAFIAAHPPEGWHSTERVKTATEQAAKYCDHAGLGFGDMWEQILYGLTPPKQPDPAVEDAEPAAASTFAVFAKNEIEKDSASRVEAQMRKIAREEIADFFAAVRKGERHE